MSNPLLEQFISESRDNLQRIGEILIDLEEKGEDKNLLNELFRLVHTMKGNSGLFDFPSMTRLLHASEDLMNLVREGSLAYSSEIADILLESMDIVSMMIDGVELNGELPSDAVLSAEEKTKEIKEQFLNAGKKDEKKEVKSEKNKNVVQKKTEIKEIEKIHFNKKDKEKIFNYSLIPEEFCMKAVRSIMNGDQVVALHYSPEEECFYKGEDPLYLVRNTPELIWARSYMRENVADPINMDIYKCIVNFDLLSSASQDEIADHFKYVLDQMKFDYIDLTDLIIPTGDENGGPVYEDFVLDARGYLKENRFDNLKNAVRSLLDLSSPSLYFASVLRWIDLLIDYLPSTHSIIEELLTSLETMQPPKFDKTEVNLFSTRVADDSIANKDSYKTYEKISLPDVIVNILDTQRKVLEKIKISEDKTIKNNILRSVISSIENSLISIGFQEVLNQFREISAKTTTEDFELLYQWVITKVEDSLEDEKKETSLSDNKELSSLKTENMSEKQIVKEQVSPTSEHPIEKDVTSSSQITKVLKVDESKVDRLMNLIGEFVVAKNSLPYLANKSGNVYGLLELSKEIKGQYSVLNRIAEEMQDAIMQIRMVPVAIVFQRFPRLVRDLSKKLNKKVKLELQGEETEADKNVIEALSDPLIHIVRNSLDHGIEMPEERISKGKPDIGTIILRAKHESDHVLIEVIDDGRGIDAEKVKLKAYQKGLITEEQFEKMKEQESINLIFLPGFSTAETTTDLSGRGVGMDVVRTTVEKFGGSVKIYSEAGKGSTVSLSLPLSMAVSHVMIIESANEKFGIPIDAIVETVRIHKERIRNINGKMVAVLRQKVLPIFYLNDILEIKKPHIANEDDEYAVVVISVKGEMVGIVVDRFHETADIILKPLSGFLVNMKSFAGSAIMGDGTVLLVINPKEIIYGHRS